MSFRDIVQRTSQDSNASMLRVLEQRQRIEASNSVLSHFVTYAASNPTLLEDNQGRPLAGLSFGVKDNIAVAHFPLSFGLSDAIAHPVKSAAIVSDFIARGASLNGSCTLDELALGATGARSHSARIINPRDTLLIPGGSSAGCAGAVSAGSVDFAIGTDSGGSIRIPAACCKLVGLKLNSDSFEREGALLLDSPIDCFGLIAPTIDDMEFLVKLSISSTDKHSSLDGFKILIPSPLDLKACRPSIASNFYSLIKRLAISQKVEDIDESLQFERMIELRKEIVAERLPVLLKDLSIPFPMLPETAKALLLRTARQPPFKESKEALLREIHEQLFSILSGPSYLLTPALPSPIPSWSEIERDGASPQPALNYYMVSANLADLAALTFEPACKSSIPLQLVSPPGASPLSLLRAASHINALLSE